MRIQGERSNTIVTLKYHSYAAAHNVAQSLARDEAVTVDSGYIESAIVRTVTEIRLTNQGK